MTVSVALYVLVSLLSVKAEFHTSRLSVEEGGTLTLRCIFPTGDSSALQWLTPGGFVAFFNGERVLKDRRYQLVQHSKNKLIIRLSNITSADGGVYKCFYYSSPPQSKKVKVTVLAVPSQPVLQVIQIPGKASKDELVLNCLTSGSRPCPKLTWLIDGHTEVFGNNRKTFESDGSCTVSSTLRVNAFSHRSAARCIVRHRTLSPGNLTAPFQFHTLFTESQTTQEYRSTAQSSPHSTVTAEFPKRNTTLRTDVPVTSGNKTTVTAEFPERNTTDVPVTSGNGTTVTVTDEFPESNTTLGADVSFTSGNGPTDPVTFTPFSEVNSTRKDNTNLSSELEFFSKKSHNTLVLVLVSLMICVLLVIVHLFLMKLKNSHSAWKKENETSDQTLESTKSRSNNEDNSGQARNANQGMANQSVTGIQYNNQVSM